MIITGKVSTFGGPHDEGVSPGEGLALIGPNDLAERWFAMLFLREQPPGTTGLARRLDPSKYYIACRWDYRKTPKAWLRERLVSVEANGKTIWARPVDWGPHEKTGRAIDLSPAAARALRLSTNDTATVEIPDYRRP